MSRSVLLLAIALVHLAAAGAEGACASPMPSVGNTLFLAKSPPGGSDVELTWTGDAGADGGYRIYETYDVHDLHEARLRGDRRAQTLTSAAVSVVAGGIVPTLVGAPFLPELRLYSSVAVCCDGATEGSED